MRSVVVYESWFGNTKRLAEEIADVLAAEGEVDLLSVADPPPSLEHVDLLVLGAPTHVHGLSSPRSRHEAVQQRGRIGESGRGARDWIEALPLAGAARVAVFDTRAHKPELLVGSAARRMARRIRKRGYRLAAEPESFFVTGTPGPLADGELERAKEWASSLTREVVGAAA